MWGSNLQSPEIGGHTLYQLSQPDATENVLVSWGNLVSNYSFKKISLVPELTLKAQESHALGMCPTGPECPAEEQPGVLLGLNKPLSLVLLRTS